ncbi:MAG: phage tail sheath family protein [Planctomycetota bacterium]
MVQEFRTPDVYFERAPKADRGQRLEKVRIDVAGFLGFASRGPVGVPMRIQSWKSFEDIYGGFTPDCFLPQSVFGYFANGGDACYVVRVAKLDGEDSTARASVKLRDLYGRPTLEIKARDPGTWGNKLKVRVVAASKPPRTGVKADIELGASEIAVDVTKGFEPKAVVKVSDGEKSEYAIVDRVERKLLVLRKTDELRTAFDAERTTVEAVEVQVQITSRDQFELHDNLALAGGHSRSLVERINASSRLVEVVDLRSQTPPPFNLPSLDVEEMLAGGRDGMNGATAADFIGWDRGPKDRCGLHAFEDVEEIGLICAPDLTSLPGAAPKNADKPPALQKVQVLRPHGLRDEREVEAVQQEIVNLCERKKTLFALLDPPPQLDADQVLDWRSRFDTKYAACYWPWLRVLDPLSKSVKVIPPSGHVAGLYARSDREQGVHKAPANDTLNDVIGLDRDVSKDVSDQLAPEGVNCIRALRGRGIRPWGARTLSSDTQWEHLNVRRLFIMVERSIAEGTEWAVFENNDWYLWKAVEREISRFLTGIWKERMLLGAMPEKAFYVRCDETTNPPESRGVGELVCDIGIAAVRPAEFIVFRIGQRTQDIITEEPVS